MAGNDVSGDADGKTKERIDELNSRIAIGRMPGIDPEVLTSREWTRRAGGAILAAEVGSAVTAQRWLREGLEAVARRGAKRVDAPQGGTAARLCGEARELAAERALQARGLEARRWNIEVGDTDIDLLMQTPRGSYGVLVGGDAKALRGGMVDEGVVQETLERVRRAREVVQDVDGPLRADGVDVMMAFPRGTDQRVIDRFTQELGRQNVILF